MKTILDEGVPEALASRILGHEVSTVGYEGWKSVKNGKLLNLIESAGFEAFITNDKRMEREQALRRRPFATLVLSITNWKVIRDRVPEIQAALDVAKPGEVTTVDVGRFVPTRFRNLQP